LSALRSTLKQNEANSSTTQQQLNIEVAQLKIKQEKLDEDKKQVFGFDIFKSLNLDIFFNF